MYVCTAIWKEVGTGACICKIGKMYNVLYQRKVDVDMLNAVKSVLAGISSVSPSSTSANTLFTAFSISQPYVDTLYVLPSHQRRPKLVLTGTSIPLRSVRTHSGVGSCALFNVFTSASLLQMNLLAYCNLIM